MGSKIIYIRRHKTGQYFLYTVSNTYEVKEYWRFEDNKTIYVTTDAEKAYSVLKELKAIEAAKTK